MFALRSLAYAAGMPNRRTYRHSVTGADAVLIVDRVTAGGNELWWRVRLLDREEKADAIGGQPAVQWCKTREQAREVYRARVQALWEKGWVRLE